jgi:hypothetical protein
MRITAPCAWLAKPDERLGPRRNLFETPLNEEASSVQARTCPTLRRARSSLRNHRKAATSRKP